MKNVF
jgi:hypothetical protein